MNTPPETSTSVLPDSLCYLNGEFGPLRDAKVSVLDRGFIFGDGVYEVLPAYGGKIFRFEQHMARLERSLGELRITNPLSSEAWLAIARRLIQALMESTGAVNQLVYIQVTRGVAVRDHVMPPGLRPTVFVMAGDMKLATPEQRQLGVSCVSADDFRWQKAHIKSTSLLGAVLARQISADADAVETVMFRDGFLSEAAASNVWVVKNGVVMGPPKDHLVLEGIRFDLIEDLCREQGIPFELRRIGRTEVQDADELMLSSATKEVLPITMLDGQPVGHGAQRGRPGPVYERLYAGYQRAKAAQSI
ncbi:branched chain amino acid: 2-keto-4-methylthiobutyrate aminotransferase [Hydrogenophaga taeniospiralis CCUG 15921]|uniref:Branched chain amino acid: 2-keto-4-methylthiobutyrate aminotransferase n=1 Tax=Hydrogenophaga taeniospiralis CCUG 15921 TaxID=1281780 RepID=A0A9X4SHM8_9BURK|nr:D-amino acid aminotransferase [Hydrogenophaga taeniospiralis]MDG5978181.1 branched chain amino acid: 2-keto-4-methylthiobutyrate aminotransferase [Hydrogenophaga taeniospiralis CCUG 15921]